MGLSGSLSLGEPDRKNPDLAEAPFPGGATTERPPQVEVITRRPLYRAIEPAKTGISGHFSDILAE